MFAKKKAKPEEPSLLDLYEAQLLPGPYFQLRFPCHQKETLLPNTSYLTESDYSLPVSVSWSSEGMRVRVDYKKKDLLIDPASLTSSDAMLLFFDTRDNKSITYMHKFCHQFEIYPEKVGGIFGKEVTRFRGDESHDLANPHDLEVEVSDKGVVEVFFPSHTLYSFDPTSFARLGFSYCLYQANGQVQKLTPTEHPHQWASLELV